ncbi:MAG TPA: hypothetical protein VEK11_17450 [Thermoanaerobaculia bacterium]|nr:hypothetical protein [Thermoanaerobaculia bacterium]
MDRWNNRDRDRDWNDRWSGRDDRDRWYEDRGVRYGRGHDHWDDDRSMWSRERDPRWGGIPGYRPGGDIRPGGDYGWRGPDRDRGFSGRYGDYDRGYDRYRGAPDPYRDDDRYRYSSGDPYMDRGYERPRDYDRADRDRDLRFRDREYGRDDWDDDRWTRRW